MTAKVLKQSAKVKTNSTPNSICKIQIEAVKFADLWSGYPKTPTPYTDPKTGKVPKMYSNQCAIRVSLSIHSVGVTMKSFKGATLTVDGKRTAIRAQELADWIKLQPFCGIPQKAETITGDDWQDKIKGRTGIVFFKDYWAREGESNATGDHIDLWNGSKLTAPSTTGALHSFARFTLGIRRIPLIYADLGQSKQILFWEVK